MNRDHWNGYAFTRWQDLLPVAERLQAANHTTLRHQMDIARIAAPTGAESQRAHAIFDANTPLHCTVDAHRVHCPGIGDNGRGLAAMLALADILRAPTVARMMKRPIELVATVGEEGEGNLLGARHYFDRRDARDLPRPVAVIVLDGPGDATIVHMPSDRFACGYASSAAVDIVGWTMAHPIPSTRWPEPRRLSPDSEHVRVRPLRSPRPACTVASRSHPFQKLRGSISTCAPRMLPHSHAPKPACIDSCTPPCERSPLALQRTAPCIMTAICVQKSCPRRAYVWVARRRTSAGSSRRRGHPMAAARARFGSGIDRRQCRTRTRDSGDLDRRRG